jgi:DNA-binding response OmpR family regulator
LPQVFQAAHLRLSAESADLFSDKLLCLIVNPLTAKRGHSVAAYRILAIDDDVELTRMIELGLAEPGSLVIQRAGDGRRGLQMAVDEQPDLILLDCDMPVMDGLDVVRQLRADARTARTPIVAMTGSWPSASRCAVMIDECNALLVKPFTMRALRDVVHAYRNTRAGEIM